MLEFWLWHALINIHVCFHRDTVTVPRCVTLMSLKTWCRAALPVLIPQGYFIGFVSKVWQVHLPCCISGGIWRVRKCVTNETALLQHRTPRHWHNFSGIQCVSTTVNHKKVCALSRAELLRSFSWIGCGRAECAWGSWTVLVRVWNSYHWQIVFLWPAAVTCRHL